MWNSGRQGGATPSLVLSELMRWGRGNEFSHTTHRSDFRVKLWMPEQGFSIIKDPKRLRMKSVPNFSNKYIIPLTLIYLLKRNKILLIKRRSDRLFGDQWLGLGGKIEPGESLLLSAKREAEEESGLQINSLNLRGEITLIDTQDSIRKVFIFTSRDFCGRIIRKGPEGLLQWHNISNLPKIKNLVPNQSLFLDTIIASENNSYFGILTTKNNSIVSHITSESYFAQRLYSTMTEAEVS